MNLKRRVLTAVGLLVVGAYGGVEIPLDRLGYVTTVFPFLPLAWQRTLVSDPVILWGVGACFVAAIILLGSAAWNVAAIADRLRKSNERSWEFTERFASLEDLLRPLPDKIADLSSELEKTRATLQGLQNEIGQAKGDYESLKAHLMGLGIGPQSEKSQRHFLSTFFETQTNHMRNEFQQQLGLVHERLGAIETQFSAIQRGSDGKTNS